MKGLERVIAEGGILLLAVPVGRDLVVWNAHRCHTQTLRKYTCFVYAHTLCVCTSVRHTLCAHTDLCMHICVGMLNCVCVCVCACVCACVRVSGVIRVYGHRRLTMLLMRWTVERILGLSPDMLNDPGFSLSPSHSLSLSLSFSVLLSLSLLSLSITRS